ncbi:dTDP-4-dehydrorhamnose reductase [Williamsia sp. CHRR-6]|uniref:dTDP-4-dehydrorhamnose reductase n=1 Tax=Williamsia sp. CHRR-6 TaxID=2835871 RepID=UPI001BDA68E7|nr:dTDP-4-dehydrorhamnose reductase [Williamsia sp. CHRR-6]MBT0568475.1 dTDP-4-dehydrorhamnose reductase [Williamsia sp. CHRR-6]
MDRGRGEHAPGRVVVVGAGGQVGRLLVGRLSGHTEVWALTSTDLDITDASAVRHTLADLADTDVVINCAAYTAVDAAETDVQRAEAVNAAGPAHLAQATAAAGAWLIHISTDYVFTDAEAVGRPLEPDDLRADQTPATVYGRTKLAGERAATAADPQTTVVRTAWVYTGQAQTGDFVSTMRRLERQRPEIDVVADQVGSPTYAVDLAGGLVELAATRSAAGVTLHATNSGTASWFDLAQAVFAGVGADPDRVRPTTTAAFPRPAPRPAYSALSGRSWERAGLTPLRPWPVALRAALSAPDA